MPLSLELRKESLCALNRPGHQLREERDIHAERNDVSLGLDPTPEDVEGVADRLEGVEADPIGRMIESVGAFAERPIVSRRSAAESTKKLKYLKNPRIPRLTASEPKSQRLRWDSTDVTASRCAIKKSAMVEIQINDRNR